MKTFDLRSTGLILSVVVLLGIVPLAFAVFVPLVAFRSALRTHRARWGRVYAFAPPGAYRASNMTVETPPRVPLVVVVASLLSLYLAVPIVFVFPFALAAILTRHWDAETLLRLQASAWMAASAIVGRAILRPSRESVRAARIVAAWEIVFAIFALLAKCRDAVACAALAAAHALTLFAAASAIQRANLVACADDL